MRRAWLLAALLAAASHALAAAPTAAALADTKTAKPAARPRVLIGQDAELKTLDGWTLKARYQAAKPGRLTFVLVHGAGMRKEYWHLLARVLGQAGYGTLGLDLRGHGDSKVGPDGMPAHWRKFKVTKAENEFANMSNDLQAAVSTLTAQGVLEETIALIGTDVGGSLALKYAAVHPKVPMVILLSPGMSYQEVLTPNAARFYRDRPILMVYSELDRRSSKETPVLYEIAKRSAGERKAAVLAVPNLHGTKMLTRALAERIAQWIRDPIKPEAPAGSTTTALSPVLSTGAVEDEEGPEAPAVPGGGD